MEQCAGLLCVVPVPPLQFISGQWSHLDVAVYIVLLDYVFGDFVSAVLLSWCWPAYLRPSHIGSHM